MTKDDAVVVAAVADVVTTDAHVATVDASPRGTRAPGRPRDERADQAIVASTLAVLAEVGPTALSVEEVASRAGVSKATIYRRFPTKDDLVVAALASLNESLMVGAPDGPVRDVLVTLVAGWWEQHESSTSGQLFPRVLAHAKSNPRMFCSFYDQVIEPRRDVYRAVIARGVESGELRADTDVELLTTLVVATSVYTLQVRASGRDPLPGSGPAEVVDGILAVFLA
jgi:AcrR family transcriptional regulator